MLTWSSSPGWEVLIIRRLEPRGLLTMSSSSPSPHTVLYLASPMIHVSLEAPMIHDPFSMFRHPRGTEPDRNDCGTPPKERENFCYCHDHYGDGDSDDEPLPAAGIDSRSNNSFSLASCSRRNYFEGYLFAAAGARRLRPWWGISLLWGKEEAMLTRSRLKTEVAHEPSCCFEVVAAVPV